jgi:hypothetical protein
MRADPPALRSSPPCPLAPSLPSPRSRNWRPPLLSTMRTIRPGANAHFRTASARSTVSTHHLILLSPGAPALSRAPACWYPHTGTGASTCACTRPSSRSRPDAADAAVSRRWSFDVSSSLLLSPPRPPPKSQPQPGPQPNLRLSAPHLHLAQAPSSKLDAGELQCPMST